MLLERIGHARRCAWKLALLARRIPRLDALDTSFDFSNVESVIDALMEDVRIERGEQGTVVMMRRRIGSEA